MQDFNYELKQLCQRNRDGSYATQADRERILTLIANELRDMGYKHMHATSLKPKHVDALVNRWHGEQISAGTFKNRMAQLRWLAEKIGKENIIARSNDAYGIADRMYVTNVSKAKDLNTAQLDKITDPYTRLSLQLQAGFGLRREESIKIQIAWADRGEKLVIKASWAKGKREREIPVSTTSQRELLNAVRGFAGKESLIPKGQSYVGQLQRFKDQCIVLWFNEHFGEIKTSDGKPFTETQAYKQSAARSISFGRSGGD